MKCYLFTVVVMKCESVYSGCRKLNNHLYKALLNRLPKNFSDTLSRNFYQHHSFYNLLMSLPSKNKVTYYKPDRSSSTLCCRLRIHGCSDSHLRFAIWVPQDNYDVQEKQKAMILFFSIVKFNISSAALTSSF